MIDYSKVTNKNTLIRRILDLQSNIQRKQEELQKEQAMNTEFQEMVK